MPGLEDGYVAVIISHDCDIPHHEEPSVEYIAGVKVENPDGQYQNSRHARRLHLGYTSPSEATTFLELRHVNTRLCPKSVLAESLPDPEFILGADEKRSLKQWLAARYGRPAYPNEFEKRLKAIERKLQRKLKKVSSVLSGVYFDLGEDRWSELPKNEPYYLGISVVFDAIEGGVEARKVAEESAVGIREIFRQAFKADSENSIILDDCTAIADNLFSLADMRKSDQWRAEYLSLGDSDDPVLLTADNPV